jgi:hypothetical protein
MKTTKCLIIAVLAMITSCAFAQEVKEIPGWPKPGPEVPSACAQMYGAWRGEWQVGGVGAANLWILEVRADCSTTFTYGTPGYQKTVPKKGDKWLKEGKLDSSDGQLSFVCSRENGTCRFKRRGDGISAGYNNPFGGNNWAEFARKEY